MAHLDATTLSILIPGQTHVLERNGNEAYVYFNTNGDAHMRLDDGESRRGHWRLLDGGYATDWENGVTGSWLIDHEPGTMNYINRDNAVRFRMLGVLFGDAKGLAF